MTLVEMIDKMRAAAIDLAAEEGIEAVTRIKVLPPEGATFEQRRHAQILTDYLNAPTIRAMIEREAAARTLNEAIHGPDPRRWPQ